MKPQTSDERRGRYMSHRLATLAASCLLVAVVHPAAALADPATDPAVPPPPGAAEGIAPLTTSLAARDWLVGGTFTGSTTGKVEGGSLEVGYQIGCGVEMDKVKLNGQIGGTFGNSTLGIGGFNAPGTISAPITGQVEVEPRPGTVTNVTVDKKTFKGTSVRVTVRDIHIKVDNCVGASSLRSYAILTSSGTDDDDIVAYYGVTKVF